MEVDEAVRMVMSLGVVIPTWRKDQMAELPVKLPESGDGPDDKSDNTSDDTAS